tara:strand:- start:413 stop:544 length:132 start_codon:yes stop_codon:yes gene_type:complete
MKKESLTENSMILVVRLDVDAENQSEGKKETSDLWEFFNFLNF